MPKRRFLMLAPYVWFPIHISSTRSPLKSTRRFKCLTHKHYTQQTHIIYNTTVETRNAAQLRTFLIAPNFYSIILFSIFFLFIRNREKKNQNISSGLFDASASWLRHTRFLAWVTTTYFVIRPILKIIWKSSVLTMITVALKTTTITNTHIHFSIFWFLSRKLLFRCILTEHKDTHTNKHALSLIQFTRFQLSYYKISDKVSFITRT